MVIKKLINIIGIMPNQKQERCECFNLIFNDIYKNEKKDREKHL